VDLLLHPADRPESHRPDPRGRLSTAGHGPAFRAFARAAKKAGVRFMVIGGTFRDVAVRASSTGDIDIVLVDQPTLPAETMRAAGFTRLSPSGHAWCYASRDRRVELQVAATASSTEAAGPFSIAFQHAETRVIEGVRVTVPRLDDYVILKLFAASAEARRRARDLTDIQFALDAYAKDPLLTVPALRARLRDLYGVGGRKLKEMVELLRQARRSSS
jgi:predicted nucleotidyltransferase